MTPSLYSDVRWALVKHVGSFEAALVTVGDVSGECIVLDTYPCDRSRTRVRVRREAERLGAPDFVCRR